MGLVFASPLLESVFYHLAVAAHTLSSDERFAVACSDARDQFYHLAVAAHTLSSNERFAVACSDARDLADADADADLVVVTSPSFFNFLPPCRLADSIIASKLLLLCRLASGYSELAAGRTWTRMRMRPCLDLSRIHQRSRARNSPRPS